MPNALPKLMRAVVLTGHGGYDRLALRGDIPVPQPGDGEVLIRIKAAGVNNTDINTRIGWYSKAVAAPTARGGAQGFAQAGEDGWRGAPFAFPRIQGADACGHIVAVGAGVSPARINERVLIEPVFRGLGTDGVVYFGSEVDGGFAEYALAPSTHAHAIISDLSDAELASFPCAYGAAENMLERAGLAAGESVLITGASGGVGSAAVQLARRRGARITAICGTEKTAAVEALGAERVVPRDSDLVAQFGRDSFDVVIDMVGGAHVAQWLAVLRRGARYAVAGAIAGPMVTLDLRTLYLKDLRIFGCTVLGPQVFANLVGYIARGAVKPLVAATYPLFEIVAAQQAFLAKRHVGKLVLIP